MPVAPGLTEARMAWYFATGEEFEASREAARTDGSGLPGRSPPGRGSDRRTTAAWSLQQAARGSPVADDVRFPATWEANVRYFQDWLVTRIDA